MANLNELKRLTKELAEEIHQEEYGNVWNLITLILDNVDSFVTITTNDEKLLYVNERVKKISKENNIPIESFIGKHIKDIKLCGDLKCENCPITQVISTRKVETIEYFSPIENKLYNMVCIPLIYDGVSGVITLLGEINGK